YVLTLLSLVATGAGLSVAGYRVVRDSTAGRTVDLVLDPSQPGFEAFFEPTPTMLVLATDAQGALAGATLLAAGSDESAAAVMVVPTRLRVPGTAGETTLDQVLATQGADATRQALALRIGVGIAEVTQLDPTGLAALVRPVEPLQLRSRGDVPGYPAGTIGLPADAAAAYFAALADGEAETARLRRQEDVWDALGAALGAAGPTAVAGEADAGISRFLHGLAADAQDAQSLPVTSTTDAAGAPAYEVVVQDLTYVMAEVVPFPSSPAPGTKVRVRLLDGAADPARRDDAARALADAGAEIVVIGNASSFDRVGTEVVHHAAEGVGAAEILAYALGGGATVREEIGPTDSYDVTVIVGADPDQTEAVPPPSS
ncbi:MAG: LytR C-terminal domain-containing protein, partial [Acidimicrobiia bacterium]